MEITGRITKDATARTVANEKQVVNFSIVINDSYKAKGSSEYTQVATFIDCSYWLNAKLAEWLKKGAMVQLFGRIGLSTYIGHDGTALGSLTFHINNLKILAFAKKENGTQKADSSPKKLDPSDQPDDLPF